jgi:cyclic-di-GMP-binding protein
MVDPRHAEEFLGRLPLDDPFRSLEEITFWLKALRDAYGVTPQRAFEAVDSLDAAAKVHQRKLASSFVALGSRYRKFQAQRAWNASFEFWRELGATYEYLVDRYRKAVDGYDQLRPALPMMVARATRALKFELKWSLLRRGPVDQIVWKLAGALYRYAEDSRFSTERLHVYPGSGRSSSIREEYLQVLMLGISATDSLLPEKLDLVESFIGQYGEYFALEEKPRPGCHYYVDIMSATAPARLVERIPRVPGIRYFGPDRAAVVVESILDAISERGMVPPEINPGGKHQAKAILDVLDHLLRYWAPTPPTRASERKSTAMRISIVHDFDSIVSMISADSQELDFNSNVEVWRVENESEGGFGAVINETQSDWLEVGSLLGIQLEESTVWGIGLVRRVSRLDASSIYVGIETLARGVVKVDLSKATSHGSWEEQTALLLLSSSEDSAGKAELVLMQRPGTFAIDRNFTMHAFEREYRLLPKQLQETGEGYELARFRAQKS